MTEQEVEKHLRKYLEEKGWTITSSPKSRGQHGCDIIATHKKNRKGYYIEVKGNRNPKYKHQTTHESFITLLGQILFRMNRPGNTQNAYRTYAIAIPSGWKEQFRKKIKQMPYGWKLLKLRVFLVNQKGIKEKTYIQFLK